MSSPHEDMLMTRDPVAISPRAILWAYVKWIAFFAGVILMVLAYDGSGERTVRLAAVGLFCGIASCFAQAEEHHAAQHASRVTGID